MKRTGILFDHLYSFDLFKLLKIKQKKKKSGSTNMLCNIYKRHYLLAAFGI